MTSTPTADGNVAAPIGAEAAAGAGPEHAPAGHEEPSLGSTTGARSPKDVGRAQRLVWLDPARLAVHPRNVRGDLGDLSGLSASIAAQGVLEALTVVPATGADGAPGYQLVAGHRRAAAAILAGVTPVPCVLRGDLAPAADGVGGDRAGLARHVAAMLPAGSGSGGGEATDAGREAAAEQRRQVIENNKAMAAANQTRRDWVKALLQRRTPPKTALRFVVETLAADPHPVSRWLSGQSNSAQDSAAADLGLAAPDGWWATPDRPAPTLTSGEQLPDARLAVALLAHVAAALEAGIDRSSWRDPTASVARWLRFLAGAGYTLADIEQQILDSTDPRAAGKRAEPDDGTGAAPDRTAAE